MIVDYPAMFLMPGFAFWTFAGIQLIEPCHICNRTTRIAVSFKMTLGQFFLVVTKISGVFLSLILLVFTYSTYFM